jgi:hypothetical protein
VEDFHAAIVAQTGRVYGRGWERLRDSVASSTMAAFIATLIPTLAMTHFTKTVLFTDVDGRARFKEEAVALDQGTPQTQLSALFASGGYQLRTSPVGFRSSFHCTGAPQWVFILGGQMEIGIQGGVSRVFGPGEHFFSADVLPVGATFDAAVHGHWSRQVGPDPLVTLFLRA